MHVLTYVGIVREYAQKRNFVQLSGRMMADAQNGAAPHAVITAGIEELERLSQTADANASPWKAARSASDFLNVDDPEVPWLVKRILARGAITEVYSPRGLGKTNVALALAVDLASRGLRVLYLDRDNPPRELRRRLRAWGGADRANLKVMLRHEVPPLKDAAAWAAFPVADYDVVIIDSLDATAEGVGEQDSAKPSRAIAPILDLARRENSPAIMVLGNTIKSGAHARGSGVIEDRADISFEVRDGTGLRPTGKQPWWEELADAGVGAWAERATRRRRRDTLKTL